MLYDYFKKGINLGGWLSQIDCLPVIPDSEEKLREHFETFITEEDITRIASWGLDHVRLPVDYTVLEQKNQCMELNPKIVEYMDRCADWCESHGLSLIIDLHNAAGNGYAPEGAPIPLVAEESCRSRFLNIWEKLAEHYRGRTKPVIMFELFNEILDTSGYLWPKLYKRAVEVIRRVDRERFILVGSNEQNSAFRLKELELLEDEKVFYNFHFYDPQVFTHQQAHFSEEMRAYHKPVTYPGDISGFTGFLLENRKFLVKYQRVAMEACVDKELTEKLLKDAFDFVEYTGKELYCGEFGVIDTVPAKDAVPWLKDCMELFEAHRIGCAMWNYKCMDFGFMDQKGQVFLEERIKGLFGKTAE